MLSRHVSIKTCFDKPEDPLTVEVDFSTLSDGTAYPSMAAVTAASKKIAVTTVNASFSKAVQ
ncbi:MAG TPA: hypothetical protein VMB49_17370 [Acidobacteriaceae bacterium]|nr:hypothetical protein [Acidobacteriaceae bacterium]